MDAGAVYVDVVEDGVLGVDDGESPKPHKFSILSLHNTINVIGGNFQRESCLHVHIGQMR